MNNDAVRNKFAKADTRPADRKLDYRGRSGEQVLKPGKPAGRSRGKPGGGRPSQSRRSRRPTGRQAGYRPDPARTERAARQAGGSARVRSPISGAPRRRAGPEAMPSTRATARRPRTSPSAGRRASAIAALRTFRGRPAAAESRSAKAAAGGGAHLGGGGGGHAARRWSRGWWRRTPALRKESSDDAETRAAFSFVPALLGLERAGLRAGAIRHAGGGRRRAGRRGEVGRHQSDPCRART